MRSRFPFQNAGRRGQLNAVLRTLRLQGAALVSVLLLSASAAHADGVAAGWGTNTSGQVGNAATAAAQSTPVLVESDVTLLGKTLVQVGSGGNFSCGLTSDAQVYCWGSNARGQLGDGGAIPGTNSTVPVGVSTSGVLSGKSVTQLSVGTLFACAVTSDGGAYCWGNGTAGNLGNNLYSDSSSPVAVDTSGVLSDKTVAQVSAGWRNACGVTSDGAAYCWGYNSFGQLGDNSTTTSPVPVAVSTAGVLLGKTVKQISQSSAMFGHTCAVTADGAAFCWGLNTSGQLGDLTTTYSQIPVAVKADGVLSGKSIAQVSAGVSHTCAVTTDGLAYCWGDNANGQLGDGTITQSTVPVAVSTAGVLANKKVAQITAASSSSCAITNEGLAYCWGSNSNGRLGNSSTVDSYAPVAVTASGVLSGKFIAQIAGGSGTLGIAAPAGGPGRAIASGASTTWQQMSLPCAPSSASVATLYGTGSPMNLTTGDYGTANSAAGTGWIVEKYNPTTNAYVVLASSDTLVPGTGYWFKSFQKARQGTLTTNCPDTAPAASVTLADGCASANGCFAITLTSVAGADRYNLVGNPMPYGVDWSQVRVRIDGSSTTYTPTQAAMLDTSGNAAIAVISNTIYSWNGTAYDAYTDSGVTSGKLPYFSSFWVRVMHDASGHTVELLVPALVTSSPAIFTASVAKVTAKPVRRGVKVKPADPAIWALRLKADDYANGWKFNNAMVGQQTGALAGYDAQDLKTMAPFASPYLYITFPRPSWGANAGDYASDFRPSGVLTAGDWPFELRASKLGTTVYLRREGDAAILKRSQLINVASGTVIRGDDARWQGNGVPVTITSTAQKFIWRYLRR